MNDEELQAALLRYTGGFIFPARIKDAPMCAYCRSPIQGSFRQCYQCKTAHDSHPALADMEHGFMYYAFSGEQSHWLMREYKGQSGGPQQRQYSLLTVHHCLYLALNRHLRCLERKGLPAFDTWTVVPSIDTIRSCSSLQHPLHNAVKQALDRCGINLSHLEVLSQPTKQKRAVNAEHFSSSQVDPLPQHILVVDDTWVSGGHISSLAIHLQDRIGARVSMLTLARYINQSFTFSGELVRRKENGDLISYQPIDHCIWTPDGNCPT